MSFRVSAFLSLCLLVAGTEMCGCNDDPGNSRSGTQAIAQTVSANRPTDNRLCLVCHELLADELISHAHEAKGILCIDCHGQSRLHMEDEMLMTRPDILFGRNEVEPFCKACHFAHKYPEKVDAFLNEWRGRDRPNGRVINSGSICTDCHGTHNLHKADAGRKSAAAAAEEPQAEWIPLFNGKDLTGWKPVGNARWTVEDGSLVGTQGDNNAPGDLLTETVYRDFLLSVTYQVEWPCNSGVWFRYQSAAKAYQADILEMSKPECYSGSLYCTGKMFLATNPDKTLVDRDGWNTLSIRAEGRRLQIWLNGKQVADVQDDTSDSGQIGFQVHPGADFAKMKIIVREAQLQPLGKKAR